MPLPIIVAVVVFTGLCMFIDLRTRRIPNVVSVSGMLAGVFSNSWYFGAPGLLTSLTGVVAAVTILLCPFLLGGVGGGDVKMMGAQGALLGPHLVLAGLGLGMLFGGVIMVMHLARRGLLREKTYALHAMITSALLARSLVPLKVSAADRGAVRLPYSVPLGLGTVVAMALAVTRGV